MSVFHLAIFRYFLFGVCVLGGVLIWGCSSQGKKELSPVQLAFQAQLLNTCESKQGLYAKTVTQFSEEKGTQTETLNDTLNATDACPFQEELAFLTQQAYDDPIMRSKFDIRQVGDTTIANLLPSETSSSELRLQKSILSEDGVLQYIETHIERNTWLYKTRIRGWSTFDSLGRYQSHEIESFMDVATVSTPFHALVKGNFVSHE